MAFFTIRSAADLGRKGIEQTADFLGLVKAGEAAYQTPNGNRLKLIHDQTGYLLPAARKRGNLTTSCTAYSAHPDHLIRGS